MFSSRITKALAVGILGIASIALVLFVASVFSFGGGKTGYQTHPCKGMKGGCSAIDQPNVGGGRFMSPMMAPAPESLEVGDRSADAMSMMKMVPAMSMSSGSVVGADRKVASTASLDLRTKSLDWTVGKIREIAKNVGGFVENASVTQPEWGQKSGLVTVKVPADRFDAALAEMKQTADQVANENTGTADVTAQYIDLSARINNKRAEEKAYENILGSATKVTDVIEVTEQLTSVRTEIESLQGQLRYLEGQTTLAAISVSIIEDPQIGARPGEFTRGNIFKASLNALVDALLALGSGLVMFTIAGLPILLILLGVLLIVYRCAKKLVHGFFERL